MIPVQAPNERAPENGIALAGMILGILGVVLFWLPLIGMLVALLGLIFGARGMGKAKRVGGKNFGLAVTGLVTGIVGFIIGLGVLAAVAIPAFLDYQHKAKTPQSMLQLRKIEKTIKVYWATNDKLPPGTSMMPGPAGGGCGTSNPGYKLPVRTPGEWRAAPGWAELDFSIDEPSYYSYQWTKLSDTSGEIVAAGDLDCDGVASITRVEISVIEGNVTATYREPTPD